MVAHVMTLPNGRLYSIRNPAQTDKRKLFFSFLANVVVATQTKDRVSNDVFFFIRPEADVDEYRDELVETVDKLW